MKTLLLSVLIIITLTSSAQITTPIQKAGFGVEADLRHNFFNNFVQSGSEDWFTKGDAGQGKYVIDTTGAAAMVAAYTADVSPYPKRMASFYRGMSALPYSIVNNRLWLDALFVRDYHGTDTTVFTTGSSKNGLSPANWVGTIQSVPDKNEILDMMMHVRRAGPNLTDSLWFFGGLSIENTSGDRYFDFELYQTDIYYDRTSQKFYGYGPDAGHTSWKFDAAGNILTPGDVIFSASYQSSVLTGIEARIWIDQASLSMTPASFNWTGSFDGASVGSQYGYAGIQPKTVGDFYTGLENSKTQWAGPFSLIRGDNSLVTDYLAGQFMEFSVNLTKLGLDPATILGGNICGSPFNRMVVKTRASASFTAALKDFVAPIDLFLAPRVDVLSDVPVLCATQSVSTLTVQNPSNASVYSWATANGHIVGSTTGTSITVDQPGTYIVTQRLAAGCNPYAYDTLSINYDINCKILASLVTDFRGNLADGQSLLNWTTNYNDGIEYFEVQRSLDGVSFESLSTIDTKPTGGSIGSYGFTDNVSYLNTPFTYYRLKMKLAKSVVYSMILRLNLPIRRGEVLMYPNPITDHAQVGMSSDKKQDLQVLVYDLSGVLIDRMNLSLNKGNNVFSISTEKWKSGSYVLQLVTSTETIHKKLIKQVQSGGK
jgi:hypothetical protein